MPDIATNRPFLSSILGAFRAHLALQKAAASITTAPATTSSTSTTTVSQQSAYSSTATSTHSTSTRPRPLTNKIGPTTIAKHARQIMSTSPTSAPNNTSPPTTTAMATSPSSCTSSSPPTNIPYRSAAAATATATARATASQRRGSDSSNEGFRDIAGAEKWYIGGRTARGEERFYKLQMVKRHRSADRLSFDRLSL